jgi:serpin B
MTTRRSLSTLLTTIVGTALACDGGQPGQRQPPPALQPPDVLYGSVTARDVSGKANGIDFNAVVSASNAFSLRVLAALRDGGAGGNLAVGGHSVHQVLGMLYAGARGQTAEQMRTVLGWQMPPERLHATMNALDLELLSRTPDVTLAIANRVWTQRSLPVLPEFLDVLTRDYGAPLALADFAAAPEPARALINEWVRASTGGHIPELFPLGTISGATKLVLANAMYLDAPWKYKFDPERTRVGKFRLLDGAFVDVDMMHFDDFLPSASGPGWQAVEIPYRGDELALVVIVPQDLHDFEARLTAERLADVIAQIKHGGIHLALPRLRFSFGASLAEALRALGLRALFEGADFSGIVPGADLAVAHFQHQVFVEMDEEGTRAAAASGAVIYDSHGPHVGVDRPFLFAIRDRPTGAILFLGRVVDPRQ